jgi:hypothetical protein
MNSLIRIRLAQFGGVALALFAGSAVAAALAQTPTKDQPRVAVVVTSGAGPAAVAQARAAAQQQHAQLRVPRTTSEQLGVTHMLAASGYDEVITVGLDRGIAIAPVQARYPQVRFIEGLVR